MIEDITDYTGIGRNRKRKGKCEICGSDEHYGSWHAITSMHYYVEQLKKTGLWTYETRRY